MDFSPFKMTYMYLFNLLPISVLQNVTSMRAWVFVYFFPTVLTTSKTALGTYLELSKALLNDLMSKGMWE